MNKSKSLSILKEVIDFWLSEHDENLDRDFFHDVCDAELFIRDNLINGKFNRGLDMKMLTDIKVDGELIDQWPIDNSSTRYESNVGEEFLIYYNEDYYLIQSEDDVFKKGNKVDVEELERKGNSMLLDYIVNHRIELKKRLETIENEYE